MEEQKADFVIVGQPKSGTTALAQFLSEHPSICMSVPKEPGYFATDLIAESDAYHQGKQKYFSVRSKDDFDKLFQHAKPQQMRGEASTIYLYSETAAENIYQHNPDTKIIIMLRNPIDMVHALHMQYVNTTFEDEQDFENALAKETQRQQGNQLPKRARCPSLLFYSERVKYAEQIQRFFDFFPRDQVLILISEEFRNNNTEQYEKVADFLNVDAQFRPRFSTVHGSKAPRSQFMHRLFHTPLLKKMAYKMLGAKVYTSLYKAVNKILLKQKARSEIPPRVRTQLAQQYYPEVVKTSELLNRDLNELWNIHDQA